MITAACPICGSSASLDPKAYAALGLHEAPVPYDLLRCSDCGLRWLSPFPDAQDAASIYDEDYYEQPVSGAITYRDQKLELAACYFEIAHRFRSLGISEGLLDVGCGTGDFLLAAQDCGVSGCGIELSEHAARTAASRGLNVRHGTLSDLLGSRNLFAAASCIHVLEHVPNADIFLDQLTSLTRPGAPIYIEVPLQLDGILELLARARGKAGRYSINSIHHHYFFTPTALVRLLNSHGIDVLSLTTFQRCRRVRRRGAVRRVGLQLLLWTADRIARRGDVISLWARRAA